MEIHTKKYCYTCVYSLPEDSPLKKLRIKDVLLAIDTDKPIQIFIGDIDDDTYELLVKADRDAKINQLICKTDRKEKINIDVIKDEALDKVVVPSLMCLQFAFIRLQTRSAYTSFAKNIHRTYICLTEILDYETGEKENLIEIPSCWIENVSLTISLEERHLFLEDICKVLKARQEIIIHVDIDEYIKRFLSIENLSTDPVLHLITLYSLYEYIWEHDNSLKLLFDVEISGKSIEIRGNNERVTFFNKFKVTRDLVAHGYLHGERTLKTINQFIGIDYQLDRYNFDRYNSKHINLINEVISKSQALIEKYLKQKLKINL